MDSISLRFIRWIGVIIGLVIGFGYLNAVFVSSIYEPPNIHGVVIPEGRKISDFSLIDHQNKVFGDKELKGSWFLVSYGYTSCPDICPTTLNVLANFQKEVKKSDKYTDLRIAFYTVDPFRDTVPVLSRYIEFFSTDFIALTYGVTMGTNHLPFEKSLGIVSKVEEMSIEGQDYGVSHGVLLYLINPLGELQAILKPFENDRGAQYFTVDKVFTDYIALRNYFG